MTLTFFMPRFDHPAVEERYGARQTRLLLGAGSPGAAWQTYDPDAPLAPPATTHALVLTDPLLVAASPRLAGRLLALLDDTPAAVAALPVANEADHEAQRRPPPRPYLVLDELEALAADLEARPRAARRARWDGGDPGLYACRASLLAAGRTARAALDGHEVVISEHDLVHRFAPMRGGARDDLVARVPPDARRVLEIGCGEGRLGEALRRRQPCRVVGIELDPTAAAAARAHLDAVHLGDARRVVRELDEAFDCIVGGDVVEHLDDPWGFLEDLRRVAAPGGRLILTLPNVANASLVAALLAGRFDYAYTGLTCAGHLRFFTRRSLHDLLAMAGWRDVAVEPQAGVTTGAAAALLAALEAAGVPWSRADLEPVGSIVTATR